jgi:undecaprenyl diphosphate synthase
MIQSSITKTLPAAPSGLHVAVIMDGSGRWAERRGWPRLAGHRAGVEAVRRVVYAAPERGVATLTLFAFSAANWRRPTGESAALMGIFTGYLKADQQEFRARGIQVNVIGRRDRLPQPLLEAIQGAEAATCACRRMRLRLAIDYSARDALLEAALRCGPQIESAPPDITRVLAEVIHDRVPAPDLDLLIRTGGEQRLSDCMLWEGAFAEIIFMERLWPDFSAADLNAALEQFRRRERRFGGLNTAVAS